MYVCSDCWHWSSTRLGKCPSCWAFWTFKKVQWTGSSGTKKKIWWVTLEKKVSRWASQWSFSISELKRLFPEWIQQSWTYLLAGEPWIWKSTIILQTIDDLIKTSPDISIAYITWEEATEQIEKRYTRILWAIPKQLTLFQSNDCDDIAETIKEHWYDCVIVDSIQTISTTQSTSVAWSASQVRFCCDLLNRASKQTDTTLFLIGHITKWWEIAWPKYLEHIVDVVLYLEGEQYGNYRFLRFKKNRYGHTDDVGIFEMTAQWLQPVYDLKKRMLTDQQTAPWNVLTVWIDNGRAVMIQIEVLLNKMSWKYPQRIAHGVDSSRLSIIIAILEKYLWLKLSYIDIYVNIPWEFTFRDNWLDLALATAIWSQYKWVEIPQTLVFLWELGLWGQLLQTKYHSKRVTEATDFTVIDKDRISSIRWLQKVL